MRRLLLAASLVGLFALGQGAYCPGLNMTADHQKSATAAGQLGAQVCRVEFAAQTPASSLDASVTALANNGCRPLLLAGACGNLPTTAQALNLASWAARFGNNGTFWQSYPGTDLPVGFIEWCNETSYRNGIVRDDWWNDPAYCARAGNYADRAAEAIFAINGANPDVKLLVQADDGGSGNPAWVHCMYAEQPGLHTIIGGWTVHPYGPQSRWQPKLDRLVQFTGAAGAPASIPIDITEYGISTDNGRTLTDNYGHPVNLTYAQAATTLDQNVAGIRAHLGSRLQHFIVYSAHDLRAPGFGTPPVDREWYFGAVQDDLEPKGAFTTEVQDVLAGN